MNNNLVYTDSRFILKSDPSFNTVFETPLPATWWSRPHEYAWAAQFARSDHTVLDAACGVSHPFKWLLGSICRETWACDIDPRIDSMPRILQEIRDDLGEAAFQIALSHASVLQKVKLLRASIDCLPAALPCFDCIVCISTFEHMLRKAQQETLKNFARHLKPDGRVIITVDYPVVTPHLLLEMAREENLVPAGSVEMEKPPKDALYSPELSLYIYRCCLKHAYY